MLVISMVTNLDKKSLGLWLQRSKQLVESGTCWRFWLIVSKGGTHFAVSFLMPKSSCKILITGLIDISAASANSRSITLESSNTISWIFSMISGVVTSFDLPYLPRCRRFPITFIKPLFCLHGVFSYREAVFNQHTSFNFFYFDKKIKTCSLLSFVTLKVNNEIGSNFDSCRLEDCTSWEKSEKILVGFSLRPQFSLGPKLIPWNQNTLFCIQESS